LLIDNYDSFTFNLYQLIAEVNQTPPLVVKNDELSWEELRGEVFDNIVISPGPGSPDRAGDFGVCADAIVQATCPVLGVCLGHQGIAHYFGGTVTHAPRPVHGRVSPVFHDGEGMFEGLPNPFNVVRYHSLMVAELPADFVKTAWTSDGIIMGLRHKTRPIHGVQFHPESICTQGGRELLANFTKLTEKFLGRSASANGTGHHGKTPIAVAENLSVEAPKPSKCGLEVTARELDLFCDTEIAFVTMFGKTKNAYWLDSSRHEQGLARFSYMGDASGPGSRVLRYWTADDRMTITRDGTETVSRESLMPYLDRKLKENKISVAEKLPFEFTGGYVGYFGYESLNQGPGHPVSDVPDAILINADRFVVFDHLEKKTWLVACGPAEDAALVKKWMDFAELQLRSLPASPPAVVVNGPQEVKLSLRHQPVAYLAMIDQCQNFLRDGESYELCLTNQLTAKMDVDPLSYYRALRRVNPAQFSSFFNFPELAVASSSPECFLEIDKHRVVRSSPIKGTARRNPDPAQDRKIKEQLENDEKTRAENLMIVDLLRNDLGRVCEVGTVYVPKLMKIETYATVHQMVSTIQGTLRESSSVIDCFIAAFPGGSMTGAPKIRSMELLEKLEQGPRGVYSGAIGFLGFSGETKLDIVIRTAVIRPGVLTIGAGGAIVALSDPEEELKETFVKWEPLLEALAHATGTSIDEMLKMVWQRNPTTDGWTKVA
jgi:para-aminobenzoate synthetase